VANTVTVAWDRSTDSSVISYNIYYGVAHATYTNMISVGNVTTTAISNLVQGTTYYLAATAVNSAGLESDFCGEVVYTNRPLNQPPTLNPIANVTVNENAGLQTVNLSGISSGSTNEVQTLTVTATSSNPALIPTPAVNYTSPSSSGSLSFTPVAYA